jgi:glycosyltransferase involved in cell wall biosynthesis
MRLSVIIAVYNRSNLLFKTLDTVIKQTIFNSTDIEILIGDDGSEEDIYSVVKDIPAVRYKRIEHSGLCSKPRNAVIPEAKGEYLAILDSDDLWYPEKLEKQFKFMEEHNYSFSCCGAKAINKEGQERIMMPACFPEISTEELLKVNSIICSTVVCRKDDVIDVGMFNEDRSVVGVDDYDMWLKLSTITKIGAMNEVLAIYRDIPSESIRGITTTTGVDSIKAFNAWREIRT